MSAPASPDETPTVEVDVEPLPDMKTIDGELKLWRARLVLARGGVGDRTVETCVAAIDRWLDMMSVAILERDAR